MSRLDPAPRARRARRLDARATTSASSPRTSTSTIPDGSFTVIVGPERVRQVDAAARARPDAQAAPGHGAARRRRRSASLPSKEVARRLGLLPQTRHRPGRHHRRRPRRPRPLPPPGAAAAVVAATTSAPSTRRWRRPASTDLADRSVDELSGGQRQRVWLAMALAQETPHPAARRADDVPRHRPPDRGPRPLRRPARGAGPHARRRPARPQPRVPLRDPPRRDARRRGRRRGRARRRSSRRARRATSSACACRVIADPETGTPLVVPRARRRSPGAVPATPAP